MKAGNLSDCELVGEGAGELKINFGPGYRVYFGEGGASIIKNRLTMIHPGASPCSLALLMAGG